MIDLHRQGKFPIEKLIKIYAVEDLKQARADEEAGKVSGFELILVFLGKSIKV